MKTLNLMLISVALAAMFAPAAEAQRVKQIRNPNSKVTVEEKIDEKSKISNLFAARDPCSLVTENEIADILQEKYGIGRTYDIKATRTGTTDQPDPSLCLYYIREGNLLTAVFTIKILWTGGQAAMQREAGAPKSLQDRYGLRVTVPEPGLGDEAFFSPRDILAVRKGDVYFLIYAERPLAPRVTEPQELEIARKVLSRLPGAAGEVSVDLNDLAAKGEAISNEDPLAVELRNRQPEGPARRGFDIGMAAAEGQTLPGPGKQRIHDSLSPAEQGGFDTAVSFSLERNRNADLAAKGAVISKADPAVASARTVETDVFYWLGFDIATGIFGDPALGALGHTATGPGSLKIRDSLSAAGQRGFNAAVKLHLSRNYKP